MEKIILILSLALIILAFSLVIPRPAEAEPVIIYLSAEAKELE